MAEEIKHTEGGQMVFGFNEFSVLSTVDDPPKVRQGHHWQSGKSNCLGAESYNIVTWPNGQNGKARQEELVLNMGLVDERFDGRDGRPLEPCGEYKMFCRRPSHDNADGDMVLVATFRHDSIIFHQPVTFANGSTVGGGPSGSLDGSKIALRSEANGRYVCAENGGQEPLVANRDNVAAWETFTVKVLNAPAPQPGPGPSPSPGPNPPPQPPQPGHPHEGDFVWLAEHYGFPADGSDQKAYHDGDLTWDDILARMDRKASSNT